MTPKAMPASRRRLAKVGFYLANIALVILMSQDVARRALVAVLGDDAGSGLYRFVRTNVEVPITLIAVALYLDLVLSRRSSLPDTTATQEHPRGGVDAGSRP